MQKEPYTVKKKGKKPQAVYVTAGDIAVTAAANGLDIVLEIAELPDLGHRMIICEAVAAAEEIIRVSWRRRPDETPEPIIEKSQTGDKYCRTSGLHSCRNFSSAVGGRRKCLDWFGLKIPWGNPWQNR